MGQLLYLHWTLIETGKLKKNHVVTGEVCYNYNLQDAINNMRLECITGFSVTRDVVKSIIHHEAQPSALCNGARDHSPSAVSQVMHDKNAQLCVLL